MHTLSQTAQLQPLQLATEHCEPCCPQSEEAPPTQPSSLPPRPLVLGCQHSQASGQPVREKLSHQGILRPRGTFLDMSIDLTSNFFKLLLHFRRQDLVSFSKEHGRLYKEAKSTDNHLAVTSHYYSVMSEVIDQYFNGNFHFTAPKKEHRTLEEALTHLHRTIGEILELKPDVSCLDLGCGIGLQLSKDLPLSDAGGVIRDLASTGAKLTGVTVAPNEVRIGNSELARLGIADRFPLLPPRTTFRCVLVEGDVHHMPFEDSSRDAAYAIYSLKYFPQLDNVMHEVARVLRPGGKFLIYDLIKTAQYDINNAEHRKVVEGLEFACGMPSLHTAEEMKVAAESAGMRLIKQLNLEEVNGTKWYHCFTSSPVFMWLIRSALVDHLISAAQALKGFHHFNEIFLSGTVEKIVRGGEMGVLSGAELFLFEKTPPEPEPQS